MAYASNPKVSDLAGKGSGKQYFPTSVQPKTFSNDAGAPTLPECSPVAFNTSTNEWVIWTSGGANGTGTISGFLTEEITLDASDDVLGNVMLTGRIDFNAIALPAGEDIADLRTSCRSGPRALGIIVENLDQVR